MYILKLTKETGYMDSGYSSTLPTREETIIGCIDLHWLDSKETINRILLKVLMESKDELLDIAKQKGIEIIYHITLDKNPAVHTASITYGNRYEGYVKLEASMTSVRRLSVMEY